MPFCIGGEGWQTSFGEFALFLCEPPRFSILRGTWEDGVASEANRDGNNTKDDEELSRSMEDRIR